MVIKNFCICAIIVNEHIGVEKKIKYFQQIAKHNNIVCDIEIIKSGSIITQCVKVFKIIFSDKNDEIIFRYPGPIKFIILSPLLILAKLFLKRVSIEIPTPLSVLIKEMIYNKSYKNSLNLVSVYCSPFLLRIVAHKILEYGEESKYFGFIMRKKSILIANPFINYRVIDGECLIKKDRITLINCSYINEWHGLDRVIKGIYNYKKSQYISQKEISLDIKLDIIGDGPTKSTLIDLVDSLGLNKIVEFHGVVTGRKLDEMYMSSNIGIGTLGSYRVGLKVASPLKHRDYYGFGLPIIMDVEDLDFPDSLPFILKVKDDNSPIDVVEIIKWYRTLLEQNDNSYDRVVEKIKSYDLQKKNQLRIVNNVFV